MRKMLSYRSSMTIAVLSALFFVILSMLFFAYRYSYQLSEKNLNENISNSLSSLDERLNSDVGTYSAMLRFLSQDTRVIEVMEKDKQQYPQRQFEDTQKLYSISTTLMVHLPLQLPLHFINADNHISRFSTTNYLVPTYGSNSKEFFQAMDTASPGAVANITHWRVDGFDSRDVCYSLGTALRNLEGDIVGYVVLDIYQYYFLQILNSVHLPELENFLLLDRNGKILADKKKEYRIGSNFSYESSKADSAIEIRAPISIAESDYLMYQSRNKENFDLIALLPAEYFHNTVIQSMKPFFIPVGICFLLEILMSLWVTSLASRPVQRLSRAFRQINNEDFDVRVPVYHPNTEIGILSKDFNDMAASLQNLIEQEYQNNILLQEAELALLKNQINPHFLYNSMNLISMTARLGELDQVVQISLALGKFYRYIASNQEQEVPLEKELEQVENYLSIYQLRYLDRLSISFDISDEAKRKNILKMLLQPLVENAMVHGIEQITEKGFLRVEAWVEENTLSLAVKDNGNGFGQSKRKGQQIALENIRKRIVLYYGKAASLTMSRESGITTILLRLPDRNDPRSCSQTGDLL